MVQSQNSCGVLGDVEENEPPARERACPAMTARHLTAGDYDYDDFQIKDWFETDEAEITAALIDRFADLTGDRFVLHMEDEAARALGFERRVAHGLLILSLIDGLKNQTTIKMKAVASLGWEWRFTRPVLLGETIRARFIVDAKRLTRDATRGIVTFSVEVRNQDDVIVQQGTNALMMLTKAL